MKLMVGVFLVLIVMTAKLIWTAPGDDGNVGKAYKYELRYSDEKPDTTDLSRWWNKATVYPIPFSPDTAGTLESLDVQIDSTYARFWAIVAVDEAGNMGKISNILDTASPDSITPIRIINLKKGLTDIIIRK